MLFRPLRQNASSKEHWIKLVCLSNDIGAKINKKLYSLWRQKEERKGTLFKCQIHLGCLLDKCDNGRFYSRGRIIRLDELGQTFVILLVVRLKYKGTKDALDELSSVVRLERRTTGDRSVWMDNASCARR